MCKVQITKELLISAAGARQKYVAYLDEQKRERSRTMLAMKRKTLMDELGELKKKRARVEADAKAMEKAADEYATKAETTSQLTFIAKSNSLRRSAKEKMASLVDIEKQIDDKLKEMKNE